MKYYAGVEGGSSNSTIIVVDETGKEVYKNTGLSTNPLLDGEQVIFERISKLVEDAKKSLNIAAEVPLDGLGLCLSGCSDDEECDRLAKRFLQQYPNVAKSCSLRNDTIGSFYASDSDTGVVIISGTGQNAILFQSGEFIANCGGWGHYFADEGSGYWIATEAYKTVLNVGDGLEHRPYNIDRMRDVILRHFNLTDARHVMTFYDSPDKKKLASLCKELYLENQRKHDPAITEIFELAGEHLARRVAALAVKANKATLDDGIKIFCVGSVFIAWDLIKKRFISHLAGKLNKFYVYQIVSSSALGAARFGAIGTGADVNIDSKIKLLHEHDPGNQPTTNL